MTKTFKLIAAAALVAATSTAALAQDVPLNTTVAGGNGAEIVNGQAEASAITLTAVGTFAGLTALAFIAGSDNSTTTTN
ncbi:hypothetical protein [uncultured Tateyamaria sp.]|uniref:hypothetical protein n=1 Tax=uncultured Tateyamaria sp. TaxID=455651 RepID=UPI002613BBC1|nr:hypothetical protein [uncultured Tateyamaria sp.]